MKTNPVCFIVLLILAGGSLFAQDLMPYRLQSEMIGTGGASFQYWKAKKDNVSEFALPIVVIYPRSPRLRLYGMTTPGSASLNSGEKYGLSGLSDVKLGGHYLMKNDKYLITFGLNLPTGKASLNMEEYAVANLIALPVFNFRVPTYGQGLDFQLGVSSAKDMDDYVFGYGLSYLHKGGFKPFQDVDESYVPGDELSFTLGADREDVRLFGKEMRLTGDLLYSIYFSDSWAGEEVFKSGNRLFIQLMSVFKHGPYDVVVLIRDRIKSKNKSGSGDMYDTERKNRNGNQFEILGYGYYPYREDVRLKGILDLKFYSDNDYGYGGATLFGLGGGARKTLSPNMDFDGDVRFYFGSVKTSGNSAGVFGLKLYGGIVYRF